MIADMNNKNHWKCRVWLNNEEVSRFCCYADDVTGLVKIYRRNARGILAPKVVEERYGQVRIECPPDD